MGYYSERNNLRKTITKTYAITIPMYRIIFDCCKRYFDNIAWKYPLDCPDGRGCSGLDEDKLSDALLFEIPDLYRHPDGTIASPQDQWDTFDQYALLDFIEFIASNLRDVSKHDYHSFFQHYHLHFFNTQNVSDEFAKEINGIFNKTGLLYQLNANNEIERIIEDGILTDDVREKVDDINELGLKELIHEAIRLHKSPLPSDNKSAVEKIWDAFERLKTIHTDRDKKASVTKVIEEITNNQNGFKLLFEEEFKKLTEIGNDFRIRHHERSKFDINDIRHSDYLFNRCLSIIALSLNYIEV